MIIDVKALVEALDDFEAKLKASGVTVGQPLPPNADACATWHSVRGTIDKIIDGLEALGVFFTVARQAANLLKTLRDLLNLLCP